MKKILIILVTAMLFASCEKTENITFDNVNGQTLAFFDGLVSDLPVIIDDTGSVDVRIGLTTISSSNRTVNISIVQDLTTADASTYSLSSNMVTIPANEHFGTFSVNGVDNGVETSAESITIRIDGVSGGIADSATHQVRIFQICPLRDGAFTGNYAMEQLTPNNPADTTGPGGPTVQVFENQVVAITGEGTGRQFEAVFLEALGIGQPPAVVGFGLICNNVIVDSGIGTSLICAQGEPLITLGPALVPSIYNPDDDSMFELTLTEYETGGGACNAAPYQVTFRFTKQ